MRKLAAAAGIIGPVLFATVLASLSIVEYPFMHALGWNPVFRPTFDWPSGLALSPVGWIMTATFLVCGALTSLFAWGLRGELQDRSGQIGTILLTWSGVAMMGLAFTTDRTISPLPVSWHGRLHDLSFMALGLMLIPAMIMLALSFRESVHWKQLFPFTLVAFALAIPTFAIKGIVFYAFLLAILAWNEVVAFRLWKEGQ